MHISSLMKFLLNVKDIVVDDVRTEEDAQGECLVLRLRPTSKKRRRCGICGKKSKPYDTLTESRRWRALDFGHVRVMIESDVRRVRCEKHGVVAMGVPWARHGSWFTRDFEQTVAWLAKTTSKTAVSTLMRVSWQTVGSIAKRVVGDMRESMPDRFDGLVRIGIDETSYRKGHKYMTVVVDHDTNALIWAAPGHGKKALAAFFEALTTEQRASILKVSADGAGWIADCVREYCPNADRCIDAFHVVQWATDALDSVRKDSWNDARREAGSPPKAKRKPGMPKKGVGRKPDKAKDIKNSKYALLKNPDNLTDGQAVKIEMLAKSDKRLYRAYLLKERLRLLLKMPIEAAMAELEAWVKWAQHCRIPVFVELQRKIRRHKDAIFATIESGLSNARIESMNNKIKLTTRMAYGFRNLDNMIAMVYLRCGNLPISLPGRA